MGSNKFDRSSIGVLRAIFITNPFHVCSDDLVETTDFVQGFETARELLLPVNAALRQAFANVARPGRGYLSSNPVLRIFFGT